MTNKDFVRGSLGFEPTQFGFDFAFAGTGLVQADTYLDASYEPLLKASLKLMRTILTTADTSNTSTGFTAKYDRASILKLIGVYEDELGLTAGRPTITSPKRW